MTARLAFEGTTVDFGVTRALDSVDLQFAPGEIVGLLGHNGAGKSTLVNVATGAVRSTGGRMLMDGAPVNAENPRQAADLGITVIHQTPALVGNLSVLDNLYLGRARTGRSRADRGAAEHALAEVGGDALGLDTLVSTLELGKRQIVDLARGLIHGEMKVLLLDEPTAALGQAETDALHALIRRLAAKGTTVIYVSHRLPDIVEVCDRVTILREGRVTDQLRVAGLSAAALAKALVPGMPDDTHTAGTIGAEVLRITAPHELVFRAGEVVGLFGVAAGEQFELLNALHGAGGVQAQLEGVPYRPRNPLEAIRQGVHLVVADRDRDGLIAGLGAEDNVFLPWRGRRVHGRRIAPTRRDRAAGYLESRDRLGILGPGAESPISAFSGGNRQKHLLATWLYPAPPKVLLLAQPTQGVDVGAKADIRRAVRQAAAEGATVLVASAESDEIAGLCNRSYVFSGGSVADLRRTDDFDAALLQTLLDLIPTKGIPA
jgi:ABC-type sugar transport system ATPase subunit